MPGVGEQAVAHIAHGRRARVGQRRAGGVGGRGAQVSGDEGPSERAEGTPRPVHGMVATQQPQPRGGPAEGTHEHHLVAGAGAGAGHRVAPGEVPQGGDRHGDPLALRGVPADHLGADPGRLLAQPLCQAVGERQRGVGAHHECHEQGGARRSHRGYVREVGRGGLRTDVVGARPVGAEVHSFDEHVRGRDHPPVRGRDHRRVVTRSGRRRAGVEQARHPGDEAELAGVAHTHVVLPIGGCATGLGASLHGRLG